MKRATWVTMTAVVVAAVCGVAVGMGAGRGSEPPAKQEKPAMSDEAKRQAEEMAAMNAPRKEHELLESMCGEFDVTMTAYPRPGAEPMVVRSTAVREMILDGQFMRETVQSVADSPMPFSTLIIIGYNADARGGGRFEVVRMSSTGSAMMPERGTFDEKARTFNLAGKHDMNGMEGSVRVVHRLLEGGDESADVYLAFEGYSDEMWGMKIPEYKAMVVEYVRKKK